VSPGFIGEGPKVPQTIWHKGTVYPIRYIPIESYVPGGFGKGEGMWFAEVAPIDGKAVGAWGWTRYLAYKHLREALDET
jgi:hypothetical protein